jgi:hypothetical protein
MEIVEISSPSSLCAFTFAFSSAFTAQGSLRLEIFPVTKERYEPPAPSIGINVMVSTIPTAQYIGAVAISPLPTAAQSGTAEKISPTTNGNAIRIIIRAIFHIAPLRYTESIY